MSHDCTACVLKKGDTVNSVENDTFKTAPLSRTSSSHDELSSWLDLKPGLIV